MKLKLYYGLEAELIDAQEHHLDGFPTIQEFLILDDRTLRNVQLVALSDLLPLLKLRLEDKSGAFIKWTMDGDGLVDSTCHPVHFMLKVQ